LKNGKGEEMNKEEIAPGIVVYSDVIPNSENLYNETEEAMQGANIQWNPARVKEGSNEHINTMARDNSTIGIPYLNGIQDLEGKNMSEVFYASLNNIFFNSFDPIEKDYMANYGIFTTWHDQWAILKYGAGQKFTNHIDDHPDYHRRISTVYYLNDNYTGGEINFPRFGITFKPKANQMIVFPSTYVYNHSVSPVVEGQRYAVVSWMR